MQYLNIPISLFRSPEYTLADPAQRATWLSLLGHCAEQENGGRLTSCRSWTDRQWLPTVGVTTEDVRHTSDLWSWEGDDLVVNHYPIEQERTCKIRREAGKKGGESKSPTKSEAVKENGKKGGRPRLQPNQSKNQSKNLTERKGKEGKEKKRNGMEENTSSPTSGEAGDSRHRQIFDLFHQAYETKFGNPYITNGGKDGKALKTFLETARNVTAEEVVERAKAAWTRYESDFYATKCAQAATLHGLCTYWNDIGLQLQTIRPPASTRATRPKNRRDERGQLPGEIRTDVTAAKIPRIG